MTNLLDIFKKKVDWITEDQLVQFSKEIISTIQTQIASIAHQNDQTEQSFQSLFNRGYFHGYVFGYFTRRAGFLLIQAGVKTEKLVDNESWLKAAVIGNLIDVEAARTFEAICFRFASQGSTSYRKGVRDGTEDANLVNKQEPPRCYLAMEILATA